MSDAAALVGLLAEEDRLRVVAAVVLGAGTAEEVVDLTGMARRRVVQALERLAGGGLVIAEGGRLRVATEQLKDAARAAAKARPTVTPEALGATPEQAGVLRNFLVDGRLASIPAQRAKRVQVLDFLAQQFEPGKAYPERDVNFMLGQFHRDYAALRRYLVDEGFVERRDGFYWRTGGTFDTD